MLTAAQVRAAQPRDRAYKIADGRGLFLYVAPTGLKSFRMAFRYRKKAQLLTFGRFPDISLADARALRDDAKRELRNDRNPAGGRAIGIVQTPTFRDIALSWHTAKRPAWSEAHAEDVLAGLERHVFPVLGALELRAIGAPAVLGVLRRVEGEGSIETARRLRQRVSAVFRRAIAEGIAIADPAAMIDKALKERPDVRHHAALLEVEEIREAYSALAGIGVQSPATIAALLVALTGVRTGSARGAKWDEIEGVDWARSGAAHELAPTWRIPAARMKLKRSRKEDVANDHLVPLSAAAVDLLRRARELAGDSAFVFPSRRGARSPIGVNAILEVHHAAGLAGRHVPHGWRAAFSTIMNERRPTDRAAIDLALAHSPKDKVEAAYNRSQQLGLRRELLDAWADVVAAPAPSIN